MHVKILVDFDQTIVPSSEIIFDIYKEETGCKSVYSTNHGWDFEGLLPANYVERAVSLFNEPIFYENLRPFPMAVEVLMALSLKHEILIVSKHSDNGRPYKTKWIEDNLPFAKVHYTATFDKSEVCGDIIIDDKLECLYSLKDNVSHSICFGNYVWNREWQGVRCLNWTAVYDYIHSIE